MLREDRSSGRAPTVSKPALSIRARVLVLVAVAIAPLLIDRIRLLQTERADHVVAAAHDCAAALFLLGWAGIKGGLRVIGRLAVSRDAGAVRAFAPVQASLAELFREVVGA